MFSLRSSKREEIFYYAISNVFPFRLSFTLIHKKRTHRSTDNVSLKVVHIMQKDSLSLRFVFIFFVSSFTCTPLSRVSLTDW